MGQYKGRYGLSSDEVMIMKSRLEKVKKGGGTDWKSLDEFCKWAVQEGYKPGICADFIASITAYLLLPMRPPAGTAAGFATTRALISFVFCAVIGQTSGRCC